MGSLVKKLEIIYELNHLITLFFLGYNIRFAAVILSRLIQELSPVSLNKKENAPFSIYRK